MQVLDWGLWAAFLQRHLCQSIVMQDSHLGMLGLPREQSALQEQMRADYGDLTLYPLVLRWIANTSADYTRAMVLGRTLVDSHPELITSGVWDYFLAKAAFVQQVTTFPLEVAWFSPAEPFGTAFDLRTRSLRPGCPRPPSRAQAAAWAKERPYDHWTLWANAWLSIDGKPSLSAVRLAFGPVLDYDEEAILKILDYIEATPDEHVTVARKLCELVPDKCDRLAGQLLLVNRPDEAAKAYELWIAGARDTVIVSNGLKWIVRYYFERGERERALEIAALAAESGSGRGLDTLAETLDRWACTTTPNKSTGISAPATTTTSRWRCSRCVAPCEPAISAWNARRESCCGPSSHGVCSAW